MAENEEPKPGGDAGEFEPEPVVEIPAAYTEESIQVLEGLEAVRKRPGMYVGDNAKKGLHQMFREVLDNSVDEALAGYCTQIDVQLYEDGSMSVRDNGRGIPVGKHEKMGMSTLTVVMTMLHAGGKFDNQSYKTSGGLHGVGVSCTNALSEWLVAEVRRDGKIYRQKFEKGIPATEVEAIGKADGNGTFVHWKPDPTILTEINYDVHAVKNRLRELAYLNPQVTFTFTSEKNHEDDEIFHFEKGIPQLVEDINEAKDTLHKVIYFKRQKDGTELEVAVQYHDGYTETMLAFSNNIHQPDGGTHVSGFNQALTRVVNSYARKMNFLKEKDANFTADDVSDGLTAVISIRLPNPSYNSQDKVKLVTPEVQGLVNSLVGDGLSTYFDENPAVAKRILDKSMIAQRMREAAKKAAEAVKRSSAMDSFGLPGKLSDCVSKNASECELFLVEGNSAGGSAKGARDRMTQAVLPLRGKILNVEKTRVDRALDNEEIKSLIAALGVGIDINLGKHHEEEEEPNIFASVESEAPLAAVEAAAAKSNGSSKNGKEVGLDLAKLRYHKVIIMTDADVDGEHIRTLLLTFFYRYMRPLIEGGFVYLAQPPLFMLKVGANERHFAQDQKELDELVKNIKKKNYSVQRFKGLGEMNAEELEETTMNPQNRKLVKVELDPEYMMEIERLFSDLMGDKVEPRRAFIERHAKEALNVDWHY